ncbi:MAG: phage antirepressor protein [Saprospiraceae bacterium]|nr:phage antirepressor protein [Saprospiraceae bacterium]
MEQNNSIALFEGQKIRRIQHNGEWWFSVVDVIAALTNSSQPQRYWSDMKKRSVKENNQSFAFCEPLKMMAADGKKYKTEAANTEGLLRIIMSVPSPKAEPLRLWLAKVGVERIAEIENPELGIERIRAMYLAKGYSEEWVNARLKSIDIRKQLTDEWQQRGVKEGQEYAILTAEIAKATFGLSPSEHAQYKGLDKQNLRDHMTNLELIFTMLGEEMTRSIASDEDAQGFHENHEAAVKGGTIAGNARHNVEKERGKPVVSPTNFLDLVGNDSIKELPKEEK